MKNSILNLRFIFVMTFALSFFSEGNLSAKDISGAPISASLVCAVPNNVHITTVTTNTALVVWNPVSGATSYVVRFKAVGSNIWRRQTSQNTSETLLGLVLNTQYEVKVRTNCGLVEGSYSNPIYFTTHSPCASPNSFYFSTTGETTSSALISWINIIGSNSYNVEYRVRYSGLSWNTDSTNTNSLLLSGLTPSTQYEFRIQTVCNNGLSSFSSIGIFTTTTSTCVAPDSLSAVNITDSTSTVIWNPLTCAFYYIINFRQTGMGWASDTTSLSSYDIINLIPGTAYEFSVQTVDSAGENSAMSQNHTFYTTSASCGTPLNLNDSQVTSNSAVLTWSTVQGAVSYNFQYRLDGTTSWQTDSTVVNNIYLSGLSPDNVYEYQVQALCIASAGVYSSSETFMTQPNSASNLPVPDHIVICILENKAYSQIIGNPLTPHVNALANDSMSTLFNESYGITHPSQPNYLHLFSGADQGVHSGNVPSIHFNTPNLARELINSGETFVTYSEGLPSVGYDGATSGAYARRHNPVANWMGTGNNQVSPNLNQPFTAFPTDYNLLPTVSFVVPNVNNDMHDGSFNTALAIGDAWVFNKLNSYIQWAKTHNSLFILTFDEDDGNHGNRIVTIFTGEMIIHSLNSQPINHHNVLRTIEEMYGLNYAGNSANVLPIHGCWSNGFRMADLKDAPSNTPTSELTERWSVYPNPAQRELNISFSLTEHSIVKFNIYNESGILVHLEKLGEIREGEHNYTISLDEKIFKTGNYLVEMMYGSKVRTQRVQIYQ